LELHTSDKDSLLKIAIQGFGEDHMGPPAT
jgi:hypothetical protein